MYVLTKEKAMYFASEDDAKEQCRYDAGIFVTGYSTIIHMNYMCIITLYNKYVQGRKEKPAEYKGYTNGTKEGPFQVFETKEALVKAFLKLLKKVRVVMTKKELEAKAKTLGITGASKMKKDKLEQEIAKKEVKKKDGPSWPRKGTNSDKAMTLLQTGTTKEAIQEATGYYSTFAKDARRHGYDVEKRKDGKFWLTGGNQ